jgi:hypothetical protein
MILRSSSGVATEGSGTRSPLTMPKTTEVRVGTLTSAAMPSEERETAEPGFSGCSSTISCAADTAMTRPIGSA